MTAIRVGIECYGLAGSDLGLMAKAIAQLNPDRSSDQLEVGDEILIPEELLGFSVRDGCRDRP